MKVTIYKNYGMLGAEKRCIYTVSPATEIYDAVEINLPDEIIAGKNEYGDLLLTLGTGIYLLREVLCGDEVPSLCIPGVKPKYIRIPE